MSVKSLEDARDGLLRYWKIRPNGGTRAELVQLATAQGFEEPLLNEWLDIFLQGFAEADWIDSPTYAALAQRVSNSTYDKVVRATHVMFNYQSRPGRPLDLVRNRNLANQLQDQIVDLQKEIGLIDASQLVVDTDLTGGTRLVVLKCLDEGRDSRERLIASRQKQIDDLTGGSSSEE